MSFSQQRAYQCSRCKKYGHNARTCQRGNSTQQTLTRPNTASQTVPPAHISEGRSVSGVWEKFNQTRTNPSQMKNTAPIIGAVPCVSVADMKRNIDVTGRVLVCVENVTATKWTGEMLQPVKVKSAEVEIRIKPGVANPNPYPLIAYFTFPKASEVEYNTDGSFTRHVDGVKNSTWIIFENTTVAQQYLDDNEEEITQRRERLTQLKEEKIRQQRAKHKEMLEEREREQEQRRATAESEYNKNPVVCGKESCFNAVPYSRATSYGKKWCDSCVEKEQQRTAQEERRKEEERVRLLEKMKNVTRGERITILTKYTPSGVVGVHKNVRYATAKNVGVRTPMFLPKRAQSRGYFISPDSIILNKEGDILYSSSSMVEECKNLLMEKYDYTEEEARTYAILLSNA